MGDTTATGCDRFTVWQEYEKIAMHFNDLLMRLRTQSLGGVAAISAIAGVIVHSDVPAELRWPVMASAFGLLLFFWVAVWVLDFKYYNRLLLGAVTALVELEKGDTSTPVATLTMSGSIEAAVRTIPERHDGAHLAGSGGRWAFYLIVGCALVAGLCLSIYEATETGVPATPNPGIHLDSATCQCQRSMKH
ncbi:MAG TPA: hypothetical protein VFA43_10770 [Gemmatimonadaceae bacterium]|nr:hypothetical protein [Gemmatimonadaceae bacterium]